MRAITLFLLCTFLAACGVQKKTVDRTPSTETNVQDEKQNIKKCFADYKSSILNDKGEEAAEYVDSRTIQYYEDILEKTKTADSTEVENLNLMDKLMVFSVRHRTSKEDILRFDGKELLEYAIKEGMVGKNSVANNEIGDIEIDKSFARGQLVRSGTPAPFHFHFYKEQGSWKIDLTSIFPIANKAFQQMLDLSGDNENDYLFNLLEMTTGTRPTSKIWEPIK